MADIFISYKRSRRDVIERLAAVLRAHGWDVWFDARLTEGEQFREEIEAELSLARCVLAIWCEQSIVSDFVRDEAEWAKSQGALIQARWMTVNPPLGFRQQQQVDIIDWQRGVPALAPLINAIERLIGEPGNPTRGPMGQPAPKTSVIRAEELSASPASADMPSHLAFQLKQALREAAAEQQRFDQMLLHPKVRLASEAARRAELAAIEIQYQALHAAEMAEEAANRARFGRPGTKVSFGATTSYETEWRGVREGFGVSNVISGPHNGDRYAGAWRNDSHHGLGSYLFAQNTNNLEDDALRYDGEFFEDDPRGIGVFLWRNGERYAGGCSSWLSSGPGVRYYENGERYEGDWEQDKEEGVGVLWSAAGRVISSGVWTAGTLTAALEPPKTKPQETVPEEPAERARFAVGERVFHQRFGYGCVRVATGNQLTVDFEKAGQKRVIDSFLTAASAV